MHYTKFAEGMGIAPKIAAAFRHSCQCIVDDGPRNPDLPHPYAVFNWYSGNDESGHRRVMAAVATNAWIKSQNLNDTIPCWQLLELDRRDPKVAKIPKEKPSADELSDQFDQWRLSLDALDQKIVPLQHVGTMALLGYMLELSDAMYAEVVDCSTETEQDIQLHLVCEIDGDYSLLIIEPNPYIDRTAKLIKPQLN